MFQKKEGTKVLAALNIASMHRYNESKSIKKEQRKTDYDYQELTQTQV